MALLGWTAFLFSAPTAVYRDVEVRVRNGSGVPFSDITIGDKAYGDLSPGADSDYLRLSEARGAGHVSLRANGRPLSIQPLGFQPGKALADGSYTYVLTISTAVSPLGGELIADSALGYLDIEVKQDALRR